MESIFKDFRYAVRSLLKQPGFLIPAVLTLAIGVAALTEIFSVVNRVLIHPLPFPEQERIVMVSGQNLRIGVPRMGVSAADFRDWQAQQQVFDTIAAYRPYAGNLTGSGDPVRVRGARVSDGFFRILGLNARLGRTFVRDEDAPGRNHVVVMSHGLWVRSFGGDPNVIGRRIQLDQASVTVVGVMPDEFRFPSNADIWIPLALTSEQAANRRVRNLRVIATLREGTTLEAGQAAMTSVAANIERQFPDTNAGYAARLIGLRELVTGPARQDLTVILIAAAFVLLIAIANVGSLLLVRGIARQKEFAIKVALGASHAQVMRQMIAEGLVLSVAGCSAGLALAAFGLRLHQRSVPDYIANQNPAIRDIHINADVFMFVSVLVILAAIIFGLAPSRVAWISDVVARLKEGRRGSGGAGRGRTRSLVVIGQIAIAVVLTISAGLNLKSYMQLVSMDVGFDPGSTLVMDLAPLPAKYGDAAKITAFYESIVQTVSALPGVKEAGVTSGVPLSGTGDSTVFTVEGRQPANAKEELRANFVVCSPGYVSTMRIALGGGRLFEHADIEGPPRAIVSESLAKTFWTRGDAIGRHITLIGETTPREVVGIVGDVRLTDSSAEPAFHIYVPYLEEDASPLMTLVVRTTGDPLGLAASVRQGIWSVDRDVPVSNVTTLARNLSEDRWPQRINLAQLLIFCAISLCLAAAGVYGLMSYVVNRRVPEFGLRMALGARPMDVFGLAARQALGLIAAGTVLGLIGAVAFTRLLGTLLVNVSVTDPLIFAVAPGVMAIVAGLASLLPTRRASQVDPVITLREE